MKISIEDIEIKEDKTLRQFVEELQLSNAPVLLEVNGEVFYPDEIGDKRLKRGDKVVLIPVITGG